MLYTLPSVSGRAPWVQPTTITPNGAGGYAVNFKLFQVPYTIENVSSAELAAVAGGSPCAIASLPRGSFLLQSC